MLQSNKKQQKFTKRRLLVAGGIVAVVVAVGVTWMLQVRASDDLTTKVEPITSSKSLQSSGDRLDANAEADEAATQQDQERLDSAIQ